MTFVLLFFAGFVAVCIFAARSIETGAPSDLAGSLLGIALMGAAILTLTGA